MDILVLNQEWFKPEFENAGHRVITVGIRPIHDIHLPHPVIDLKWVLEQCPEDFNPERIVIFDDSAPIMIERIEESGIPVLFYSVDCHHHSEVHRYTALNYDVTLIAQKDYIQQFEAVGVKPLWFPLWSSVSYEPSDDKQYDAVFVGTMDRKLNPDRVLFFEELQKIAPVHCTMGQFWDIFPHSEIILNQTVKGDLNFRVFEAMMSGSVLLTEDSPNGLKDLFEVDRHLVTYSRGDVNEAAYKINNLLKDRSLCKMIGAQGRNEILCFHTTEHRAKQLLSIIESMVPRSKEINYFFKVKNTHWMYQRTKELDTQIADRALGVCIQNIKQGLSLDQTLNDDIAYCCILPCFDLDMKTGGQEGLSILQELDKKFPHIAIFRMAVIWKFLNAGHTEKAKELVASLPIEDSNEAFSNINQVMNEVIRA